jgi:altronate hydrolase
MKKDVLNLNPADNVGIVLSEEHNGIRRGHKVALRAIGVNSAIVKFGHVIGISTQNISVGAHVHVHNVRSPNMNEFANSHETHVHESESSLQDVPKTFLGFPRKSGRAGIRNYITVVAPVNCSATVVKAICRNFINHPELKKKNIDSVVPVTYFGGCALDVKGSYHHLLARTLSGWIYHPNVVGSVVVGLGCEGVRPDDLIQHRSKTNPANEILYSQFDIQKNHGTAASIKKGIDEVEKMIQALPKFERVPVPVSNLSIALNCGGSDGFSAITANPVLGAMSDICSRLGATSVLAEIPECHGAEGVLLHRIQNEKTKNDLLGIFEDWYKSANNRGITLNSNLAKGNIEGGITTIVEKSLGAVVKSGTAPITQVVDYADYIDKSGIALMNTPGYDPVSVTGLAAGGCNVVVFTTGRGSVYGCGIAPTIKVATTSQLFENMRGDMDFNAGRVLENESVEKLGVELFKDICSYASGTMTSSESLGIGWEEFVPWPEGMTL